MMQQHHNPFLLHLGNKKYTPDVSGCSQGTSNSCFHQWFDALVTGTLKYNNVRLRLLPRWRNACRCRRYVSCPENAPTDGSWDTPSTRTTFDRRNTRIFVSYRASPYAYEDCLSGRTPTKTQKCSFPTCFSPTRLAQRKSITLPHRVHLNRFFPWWIYMCLSREFFVLNIFWQTWHSTEGSLWTASCSCNRSLRWNFFPHSLHWNFFSPCNTLIGNNHQRAFLGGK